jgi:hypothetical protein
MEGGETFLVENGGGAVYRQWFAEYDHPLPEGKTYEYGIVLGGYSHWDWERNRIEFSNIADLTDTPVKVDDRKPSWFRSLFLKKCSYLMGIFSFEY